MSEKNYSRKNILSMVAFGAVTIAGIALITGCDRSNQEPTVVPVFTPHVTEFVLEDGTRCVMFSTVPETSARAGASGASCDWK